MDAKAALMHAHRNNIRVIADCLRRISRMPSAITSNCGFRKNEPSCATTSKGDYRPRAVLQALQSTEAHRAPRRRAAQVPLSC